MESAEEREARLARRRVRDRARRAASRALQWLITNNRYYRANQIRINLDTLSQLPEDSGVINDMSVVRDNQTQQAPLGSTAQDSDVQDDHLPRSSLSPFTEEEAVRHSVQQRQQEHPSPASSTLMWPSIGGTPINEFTTEGYFSCAFPTLFPTGDAEFLGPHT